MAYRKLIDGDLVKVIRVAGLSGSKGIVIDAGETKSRVQIRVFGSDFTNCVDIQNEYLLIRDEPNGYIEDGRVNSDKYDDHMKRQNAQPYIYSPDDSDEDDRSEFHDLDFDDLVDMIVKLRNDVSTLSDAIVEKDETIIELEIKLEGFE